MAKKKSSMWMLFLVFLLLEAPLAWFLDYSIKINFSDKHAQQGIWLEKHHVDLQEKIQEEFQPDEHALELHEKHGEPLAILGSEKIYQVFKKIFPKSPIGTFNLLRMLLILDIILLGIILFVRKAVSDKPSIRQILFEQIYSFFEELVVDTLGEARANFTPYVATIFIFIWSCNMIGLVPIPGFMEPTRNLNVPLGMGIMVVAVVHFMAFKVKGPKEYFADYARPLPFLLPLNILDVVSKAVSIAFRLFGNILGGAIIILVVSSLVKFVLLPVGLNFFFGIFVGTIQAFVFTMLALTYIAVEIAE